MRVAYILPPSVIVSGVSNGVRVQAESWKSGIEALGPWRASTTSVVG